MAMTACYPTYDLLGSQNVTTQHTQHQLQSPIQQQNNRITSPPQKDYSIPLHVDCSVEYELPNQAKPPVGARMEPLLMIHPCYFRKMESQRRSPFVNNMPNTSRSSTSTSNTNYSLSSTQTAPSAAAAPVSTTSSSTSHRSSHNIGTTNSQQQMHSQSVQQPQQMEAYVPRQLAQQPQYSVGVNCGNQQQPQYPGHSHQLQHNQMQQQQIQHQTMQHQTTTSNHYAMQAQHQSHMQHQQQLQTQQRQQHQLQQQQHHHQTNHMHIHSNTPTWDRFMNPPASIVPLSEKSSNRTSQSVSYNKKTSTKRGSTAAAMLPTSCTTYNSHAVEGGLPSLGRWESEKTSMAAIPRDYNAAIPEIMSGATQQQSMYRGGVVGKRDAMLSGGCSNSNINLSSNNNYINLAAGGLWETDKSIMATTPRGDFQAAIPESLATKPTARTTTTSTGQQHNLRSYHEDKNNLISNKYRQYLRSQRTHPYMMGGGVGITSSTNSLSTPAYTHMTTATAFPQMQQQVTCYNV